MKYLYFTIILICTSLSAFSQGENNMWYFGQHAGLNFNSGFPVPINNAAAMFLGYKYSSSPSDSLGNILFYESISYVFNRNNVIMPHGSLLGTVGQPIQSFFAAKKPDEDSVYYLFVMNGDSSWSNPDPTGLTYTIIDMKLDGGLGDVRPGQTGIPVPGGGLTADMLTGTRAKNNRDVWIVARDRRSYPYYLAYKITNAGLDPVPVISTSLVHLCPQCGNGPGAPGMAQFSPDGNRLVVVYDSIVEFCQFNPTTGEIAPMFLFYTGDQGINWNNEGTAEFSINNKFLYISSLDDVNGGCNIYQYDASKIDSAQFKQSEIFIHHDTYESELSRGPDHKIYGSHCQLDSIDVINKPFLQGVACNFQKNAVSLNGNLCWFGLVQHLEKYYTVIHYTNNCEDNPVNFTSSIWPQTDSIHWDFGDPSSGPANFSSFPNPSHTYSTPGTYNVSLYVWYIDKRKDTAWQVVTVHPTYEPSLGPDLSVCLGTFVTFDAGTCSGCSYQWKDLTTGLPLGSAQTYSTSQAGIYEVSVTNTFGCIGRDTAQLITNPQPVITNNPLSKTICSGESTNIALTSNQPGTNFHWTASLTSGNITGFSADSGLVINQVLTNNGSAAGIVTYNITLKLGGCSGPAVVFPVTVNPGDSVKVSISVSDNNVCEGTQVTFTASPTNGGASPSYQWKVNGINVGPDSFSYSYSPVSGDLVSCVLTSSSATCITNNPASSNQVMMVIISNLVVGVLISASADTVCAGTSVTFTASPTNGGATPSYQWKVNGTGVGSDSPVYSYIPLNGDLVTCILNSSETCTTNNPASSNPLLMVTNSYLVVNLIITASANPFCEGSSVTFTATPTNGGITPFYQWKVNGNNVGGNSPSYIYNPSNNDLVSCEMTSNIPCPFANPVTSNILQVTMNNNLPAGINITASANPFCPGNSVIFTATPSNGGTNPAYQWKVNGANAGSNSSVYTYNPASGDLVSCIITSNLTCVSGNPATSNTIIMSGTLASQVTFTRCNDSITTTNAKPFKLKGGIPLGGTYSGSGVTNGILNPAIAGAGTKTITYSYTNSALCTSAANIQIVIHTPSFPICGSDLTDIRDNKIYHTIQIGGQCWMAEDLNYGTEILSNIYQRDNCTPEKYTVHSSLFTVHSYYQWDEIMSYDEVISNQGLCPPAWHVPTESDWNTLFANYTNNGFAASPLKYSGFSGFNALLTGARHMVKTWDYQTFATFFWSSTAHGNDKAYAHGMNDADPSVSLYPSLRNNAFSVRCIKDN